MAYCPLDILPVELIHHLLNYFLAHEILYTFTNVSSYIDNVLLNYSNYCVNFKSVTRKEFESVCQRIKPNQVVSLTLSDDEDTPGQVQLFLSHFQINQFTRLRSFRLVEVGPDFWEPIVTKLIDLKNLRSFIYDSSGSIDSWVSKICFDDAIKLDKRLSGSYGPVLPQLNRLRLGHGDYLPSVQFPYLRHLILQECKANIMKHICCAAPQLKSLETELQWDRSKTEFSFSFNQLNRLVLRAKGSVISMNNMEELMRKLPSLKYLELCGYGDASLLDGQRWQMITSGLNIFNFMLQASPSIKVENLDSFRSPFWLTEKHWYVAYSSYGRLFSVPYFATTESDGNFQPPDLWTAPDISIFYRCVRKLTLSESVYEINHRFSEVETLSISNSIHLLFIEQIVDPNRIQRLTLSSITRYFELIALVIKMPNLYQISIIDNIKHFLEEIGGGSFEQIQNLDISHPYSTGDTCDDNNYNIEQLCSIFPCVKHLHIAHACSETQIFSFMNQLKQLTVASFRFISSYSHIDNPEGLTEIQSALNHHRFARKLDYSYRLAVSSLNVWL